MLKFEASNKIPQPLGWGVCHYKDKKFQKHIKDDLKLFGRKDLKKLTVNQLNFFLEECLLFYLIAKGKVILRNDYIQNHEKWVLWCYPGKPLKSQIYLIQNNIFGFNNKKNKFENCYYDLKEKKLYDFSRINLNTL